MDNNIIVIPSTIEMLMASFREIIKEEIKAQYLKDLEEKLLTANDVKELFAVSTVTIASWTKKGLLIKHPIGGRNFYKNSEVMESLKTLKKYKV